MYERELIQSQREVILKTITDLQRVYDELTPLSELMCQSFADKVAAMDRSFVDKVAAMDRLLSLRCTCCPTFFGVHDMTCVGYWITKAWKPDG